MADITEKRFTLTGRNVQMPQISIQFKVVSSSDHNVVYIDKTGTNEILFPNVLTTLTADELQIVREGIVELALEVMRKRQGV